MARMYVGIEFYYFWKDASLPGLEDYSLRLGDAFRKHYRSVGFSEREFVRTFEPLLIRYNPHGGVIYRFDLQNNACSESWEVKLWLTQISHLTGGVLRLVPNECSQNPDIGHALLEERAASVVGLSEQAKRGLGRFLGMPVRGRYIGDSASVYLWKKIRSSQDLDRKLRWESFGPSDFNYLEFADHIATLIYKEVPPNVELSYMNDELRCFIQQCDDLLKSQLSATELVDLFSLIKLSPSEWLALK